MPRFFGCFALSFALVGCLLPPQAPTSAAPVSEPDPNSDPQNWLNNPGFEETTQDAWDNLRAFGPGRTIGASAFLANQEPAWNALKQALPLQTGATKIILSGYIKTAGVDPGKEPWMQARATLDFVDEPGKQVGGWQSTAVLVSGTSDWTHFEHSYTVPTGAARVTVELGLPNVVGKVWFDDVSLKIADANGKWLRAQRSDQSTTDTRNWLAYQGPSALPLTDLDLSFLNEKPAGKHGFLKIEGSEFKFADGTPVRFWGTTFAGANALPNHADAEGWAQRLARLGVNLVRLHHMDAEWSNPNLFNPQADETQSLNADALDRMFFFIAALKKNGIYVYPDLLVHRKYRKADAVPEFNKLEAGAKGVFHFSPRIQELARRYAQALLTQKNPYTGLSLVDDPVLVGTEVINESSIFAGFTPQTYPPSYAALLDRLFAAKGGRGELSYFVYDYDKQSLKAVRNPENAGPSLEFLFRTARQSYQEFAAFLRSIGYKAPLAGSNIGLPVPIEIATNTALDFMDTHSYWSHPEVWNMPRGWEDLDRAPFDTRSELKNPFDGLLPKLTEWQVKDRPLFVTEWNNCFPNEARLEGPLYMATYGSLQGFAGILHFDTALQLPGSVRMHPFNANTRPDHEALNQTAALIYRKGYVKTSVQEVVESYSQSQLFEVNSAERLLRKQPFLAYAARVSKHFSGSAPSVTPELGALLELHNAQDHKIRSSTGELELLYESGLLLVNTPKAQGFVGALAERGKLQTQKLELSANPQVPWASIALVALDDLPLADSKLILLSVVGRAENSGQVFNPTRTALKNPGHLPILLEPVPAELTLHRTKTALPLRIRSLGSVSQNAGVKLEQTAETVQISLTGSAQLLFVLEAGSFY